MEDKFHKYLAISEEEHKWGLYITGAGHVSISKNSDYPPRYHPSTHYFEWAKGRKLSAYQILYITSGSGFFESEVTKIRKINPGDILILFPGIWHRYQPDRSTGWNEYWVEFNGELINHFRKEAFLTVENPVITAGLNDEIVDDYMKIIRMVQGEKPGFQYSSSGIILHLLGIIYASAKFSTHPKGLMEKRINEAKLMILENLNTKISQEVIAKNIGMGYSLYRKKFREFTGVSPSSYQMQMRINIAKHLLISSDKTIKEIALNLGFETLDYFCRYFKQKAGLTPSDFREKSMNRNNPGLPC